MRIIRGSENFPNDAPAPAVALGNFDGVHAAHRRIIVLAISMAKASVGTSAVYTFEPHPVKLLSPAECPPLIQTLSQRLHSIEELGVDLCIVEPFTPTLAALSADEFFQDIVVGRIHARSIAVGYDFTFGAHRHGTTERLAALCLENGVEASIEEPIFLGDTLVSSTNIRRLIANGDVAEAARLLGRFYAIEGEVKPGRGLGKKLLVATANIDSENEIIPNAGVYLTRTSISGINGLHRSVTSIGDNPTFKDAPFSVETHIIDDSLDIIGKRITIEFLQRISPQTAFESTDELRKKIFEDIAKAKKMHEEIK